MLWRSDAATGDCPGLRECVKYVSECWTSLKAPHESLLKRDVCADSERRRRPENFAEKVDLLPEGPPGLPIWRRGFIVSGAGRLSSPRRKQLDGQRFLRNIHLRPVSHISLVFGGQKFTTALGLCSVEPVLCKHLNHLNKCSGAKKVCVSHRLGKLSH